MCYSVESSLRTTLMSFAAIAYLLSSQIPHYQWLAVTLSGWCLMQFAELLLWLTEPQSGCSPYNKLITLTLIPLALALQPLGSVFGSLYVMPWAKSSDFRKMFIVGFSVLIIVGVAFGQYYKPDNFCTIVTPGGHLYWHTTEYKNTYTAMSKVIYFIWGFLILLPLFLFWDRSFALIAALIFVPLIGFSYELLLTDARGSIWCYYTSYSSVIMAGFLLLKQLGVYNVLVR
jgi:hypothetical protein